MIASPLSREFALNVANWRLIGVNDEEINADWEMWRNEEGQMVDAPKFAESVDALLPYVKKFMNISGGDGTWSVSFVINDRNDMVCGSGEKLSEALAKALIAEEKANRY